MLESLPVQPVRIGVIRSPFKDQTGTPIQPAFAEGAEGTVEIDEAYRASLSDLHGFDRVWLIYWFDRAGEYRQRVIPYRDVAPRGLFATRAPVRPNPIGLSCVRLLAVDVSKGILKVADLDILDGTPLLDIKPYVPAFDAFPSAAAGWLDTSGTDRRRADERF
jgi:tRNA-Thr(GGU) m(6)t(6)A37 methyltransferase TsaA